MDARPWSGTTRPPLQTRDAAGGDTSPLFVAPGGVDTLVELRAPGGAAPGGVDTLVDSFMTSPAVSAIKPRANGTPGGSHAGDPWRVVGKEEEHVSAWAGEAATPGAAVWAERQQTPAPAPSPRPGDSYNGSRRQPAAAATTPLSASRRGAPKAKRGRKKGGAKNTSSAGQRRTKSPSR